MTSDQRILLLILLALLILLVWGRWRYDIVALGDVLDWARPQQVPVVVFPGTGHFFHGVLIELQNLVTRFCRD